MLNLHTLYLSFLVPDRRHSGVLEMMLRMGVSLLFHEGRRNMMGL